jgi:hypothetical protein
MTLYAHRKQAIQCGYVMSSSGPEAKPLSEAAKRALAEAEARRKAAKPARLPKEIDGRDGPEPTRFGDWEKDGIISDF